jgi:hypothetical protein
VWGGVDAGLHGTSGTAHKPPTQAEADRLKHGHHSMIDCDGVDDGTGNSIIISHMYVITCSCVVRCALL